MPSHARTGRLDCGCPMLACTELQRALQLPCVSYICERKIEARGHRLDQWRKTQAGACCALEERKKNHLLRNINILAAPANLDPLLSREAFGTPSRHFLGPFPPAIRRRPPGALLGG